MFTYKKVIFIKVKSNLSVFKINFEKCTMNFCID